MMHWDEVPAQKGQPDFNNLLDVLARKQPSRPTLFEFFLNERLFSRVVPELKPAPNDPRQQIRRTIHTYQRLGYDYVTLMVPGFSFSEGKVFRRQEKSVSLNEGSLIHTRQDLQAFQWPDPQAAAYQLLDELAGELPAGMKLVIYSPDGVFENVVDLVGFENLCLMILDDRQLAEDIFAEVGARLLRYYQLASRHDSVGACIGNDDWGFKTHTLLSPPDLRHFVFPWYERIVESVHAEGKPVILHSCGQLGKVVDDIIDNMGFDGRHSYEDSILPVEQAYELYHQRIAILGGIDVDFVCRARPEEVYQRSKAMLERTVERGGYALGTGNSVPEYVPDEGYFAMIRAALDLR
jgi:uroporphyrinogen decarboxylase